MFDGERIDVGGGKTMQQSLSEIPVMCTSRISLLVGILWKYPTVGVIHLVDIEFGDLTTNFSLVGLPMNTKDTSTIPS